MRKFQTLSVNMLVFFVVNYPKVPLISCLQNLVRPLPSRERPTPARRRLHKPSSLPVLCHNLNFQGMAASRPGSLLPPNLAALPGSEDTGAAPHPVHCGGAGHTPLPTRLQTRALHRLCPTPHFC